MNPKTLEVENQVSQINQIFPNFVKITIVTFLCRKSKVNTLYYLVLFTLIINPSKLTGLFFAYLFQMTKLTSLKYLNIIIFAKKALLIEGKNISK